MISPSAEELKELAHYNESEFLLAMKRVLASSTLPALVHSLFPQMTLSAFTQMAEAISGVEEFQAKIIAEAIESLLRQTAQKLSLSGLEHLDRKKKVLFISNHRDIISDPSLLIQRLIINGYGSPLICLGDNLLSSEWIRDLVKMNKGVTVIRSAPPRELLRWSQVLSFVIAESIHQQRDSVWLAQRAGRAKEGIDSTHSGIIKMLSLAGTGTLVEKIAALHLVPVAVSYEFDPCDALKAREVYLTSKEGGYEKSVGEDVQSMIQGIRGYKGNIHIAIGMELKETIEEAAKLALKKEQIDRIVQGVDAQIHRNYRQFSSNYIAYDLLEKKQSMRSKYSLTQEKHFLERMENQLKGILSRDAAEAAGIRHEFLRAYANPVAMALGHEVFAS